MKVIDKPLSETAAKVLAILYTKAFSSNGPHSEDVELVCINDIGKSYIADRIGLSIKRVSNIITELVSLHYLERTSPTWYRINQERVSQRNKITEIKTAYRFY